MERRVVITGMGIISPNGNNINEFWKNISEGFAFNQTLENMKKAGYGNVQACKVKNFDFDVLSGDLKKFNPNKKLFNQSKNLDFSIKMGLIAANQAIRDSGLDYCSGENKIGTYIGNAEESVMSSEEITEKIIQKSFEKVFNEFKSLVKPLNFLKTRKVFMNYLNYFSDDKTNEFIDLLIKNCGNIKQYTPPHSIDFKSYAMPSKISSFFNFHGPCLSINTACASGLDAIGHAYNSIKNRDLEFALAGGCEAPIALQTISSLNNLGVLSKTKPMPFSKNRDGFAISEGAGIVFLESLESAKKRKAKIYAEIKGYAQSLDANYHSCKINSEGTYLKNTFIEALNKSKINQEDLDYINIHGTSTKDCEIVETKVIKEVCGSHAYNLNISSTKPMTGHSIGAIGGIETIITSLSLENKIVPPTINLENPEPFCDLNNTPNYSVNKKIRNSAIFSMGFGGYNSVLILSKLK
jgi:3-oxoacyl-[acyl-carrier-protein] synthase II